MNIALEESQEDFVKQAVSDGRYPSEQALVTEALRLVSARDRKLAELRATISSSIAAGGSHSAEEMEADIEAQCQELHAEGIPW